MRKVWNDCNSRQCCRREILSALFLWIYCHVVTVSVIWLLVQCDCHFCHCHGITVQFECAFSVFGTLEVSCSRSSSIVLRFYLVWDIREVSHGITVGFMLGSIVLPLWGCLWSCGMCQCVCVFRRVSDWTVGVVWSVWGCEDMSLTRLKWKTILDSCVTLWYMRRYWMDLILLLIFLRFL